MLQSINEWSFDVVALDNLVVRAPHITDDMRRVRRAASCCALLRRTSSASRTMCQLCRGGVVGAPRAADAGRGAVRDVRPRQDILHRKADDVRPPLSSAARCVGQARSACSKNLFCKLEAGYRRDNAPCAYSPQLEQPAPLPCLRPHACMPDHNSMHAADVMMNMHLFIRNGMEVRPTRL